MQKLALLFILFSASISAYEIDLDALMSYQTGNTSNTVFGSNASFKTKEVQAKALYLYADNDIRIDRQYELNANADFPIYGDWGSSHFTYSVFFMRGFVYADLGRDSKKHLDNYNKGVIGLSYGTKIKYSIGLGRQQENNDYFFVTTHRLKYEFENGGYKLYAIAWYIKNSDDYDITFNFTCKREITKILRVGVGIDYRYDSSPISGSVRGDFLSKLIIGISL